MVYVEGAVLRAVAVSMACVSLLGCCVILASFQRYK